jgi:hypothetical protein
MSESSATHITAAEECYMSRVRGLQNFINGAYVDASDGRTVEIVDPATGEVFAESPASGPADIDAAFKAAAAAFESGWRDATPGERQIALNKFADAVEERADELVAAEVANCGKPVQMTKDEEIFQAGALFENRLRVGLGVVALTVVVDRLEGDAGLVEQFVEAAPLDGREVLGEGERDLVAAVRGAVGVVGGREPD